MTRHPAIARVIDRVAKDEIGGAADTAREVVSALAEMVRDSSAKDPAGLSGEVETGVIDIMRVMPSLAPPINALHRMMRAVESAEADGADLEAMKHALLETSRTFLEWAEGALQKVGQYGAETISDGDRVFMYSMSSTVWRILRVAKAQGKTIEVVVTESRPGNEGLWTVREMEDAGILVSVGIDASLGELIPECDSCFVGADAVASTGSALCKTGTYPSALVAKAHGVPFYVAADTMKFDSATLLGLPYRNEPIRRSDVLDESFGDRAAVVGFVFDETPPELITAVITEIGILNPAAAFSVLQSFESSEKLNQILPAWARGQL